ncbi:MAG: SsrA-binding protein SmpB [Bacteroidales bacterium]|jgi:SsrA-binding protein|nr:SsrA-binding protein SmpB [Bacteroidales bacterium]
MRNDTSNIVIRNRRASHDYEFMEKLVAGIKLTGTEIKSIRAGKATLTDSFCAFRNGELFVTGMHISEYYWGNLNNHDPLGERKLLLTRKELRKWERKINETGLTIIVTKVFINNRGLAKAEIALAKGKKQYDKRDSLRKRDHEREMDQHTKEHNR